MDVNVLIVTGSVQPFVACSQFNEAQQLLYMPVDVLMAPVLYKLVKKKKTDCSEPTSITSIYCLSVNPAAHFLP